MDDARREDYSCRAEKNLMGARENLISAEKNQMCARGLR